MNGIVGVAINPYVPQRDDELPLNKGDSVKILEKSPDGRWRGEANGLSGWFPSNCVEEISDNTVSTSNRVALPGLADLKKPEKAIHAYNQPAIQTVIALYSFEAPRSEELSFIQEWNQNLLHTIKNNSRMVEIDSRHCSPNFLTQDSFYGALNSAPNLFFIDVDIGEIEISANLEAGIKDQLKEFKNSIIIQCRSLSNSMAYVKEPNKEPIILDLNNIRLLDKDKINEILREAINNKQYKIYAYLQSKGVTFNDGQKQIEIFEKLENFQKEELQKELDYYFVPIKDAHILFLVSKTKAAFHMTDEFKEQVEKWYRKLDEIDEISAILKVLAVIYSGLDDIIFDEETESTRRMCVHGSDDEMGSTEYFTGRINVGAKMEECELLGTLAHELTHFAMERLYRNNSNPYDKSDSGEKCEQISEKLRKKFCCRKTKDFANTQLDPIIKNVFKYYEKEEWHSELIVRIPHILAKYGKEYGIALLKTQAEDLLNYYNETIIPSCRTFVQEKHLIQPRNYIELLNQYLDVIDTIKNSGVELKDPIKINSFLSQQKQDADFKNFLLIRTENILLTSCSVHQSLKTIPEYSKANSSLFLKLDEYKCSIGDIFISDAIDLLVVIYSDIPQQIQMFLTHLSIILGHRRYKKIIFIIQKSDINKFKKYFFKYFKEKSLSIIEDEKFTLNHLTDKSQRTILDSLVTFQGKKIKLNQLIVQKDERLKELIDSEMLVKLIKNEVAIGNELINLRNTKNYYIDRTFKLPCLKETIFKDEKSDDLLAISGIDKISLSILVQEANKICLYEEYDLNGNVSFIILDKEQADQQFEQLCRLYQQRNQKRRNIHWLKFEQDNLIWKRSHGSISKLHEYLEDEKNYTKQYQENKLLNQTNQQKVIIISDTSGMGKSTVLTNLASQIKEHDPALWLIRINLNEHTDQLEKVLQHKLSMKTIEMATQFLANDVLELAIPFEQALFNYYCQDSHGKLIIMLDGFDEICPDYRDIVIDLMLGLRNSTIKQLWVTSRPTEQLILEQKLQNISYKLESFSEQNQIDFLTKFWQQTLNTVTVGQEKFKVYANALIKLLSESTSDKDKEFTGIPLQIRMLAEAFDFETFYNSSTDEPQLPNKLDLSDLYERFLNKKYDIYQVEKNKLDTSKPRVKILSGESYAEFIRKHQNLALWTLFKEHKLLLLSEKAYQEFSKTYLSVVENLFKKKENIKELKKSLMNESEQEIKSFIDDIKEGKANTGIVEDKNNFFIHQTFAEYLVVKFLIDNLDNMIIATFLLEEIFLQPEYQVIRAFFNSQIRKISLRENTLSLYGEQIERLWQKKKNLYNKKGMTLLHLAGEEGNVEIIRFLLNSLKEHATILKSLMEATTTYKNQTALHLAAAGGHLDVVQCLVKHGADVNVKSNSDQSALHYATQKNKWDVVKWLVKHGKANVEAIDNEGKTVLHWVARDNIDLVQWLVEHGKANADAIDKYGQAVLHCAAQLNKWDVVKCLVQHGADANAKSKHGQTVLHWAARNNLDVVQYVVEHGKANVDAIDNFGQAVLHCAAQSNKWDVVQWLVEHGADADVKSKYGQTVLHWAARDNLAIVQYVVKHGKANVDAIDNFGQAVLHCAAQSNKWDVVQWLVEHGADVNVKSKDGKTVLHWAARGNLDVVQWLVRHGADVNAKDKYGKTALNIA